jgi:hypothetical protein
VYGQVSLAAHQLCHKQPKEVLFGDFQVRLAASTKMVTGRPVRSYGTKWRLARRRLLRDRDTFRNNTGATNGHFVGNLSYRLTTETVGSRS